MPSGTSRPSSSNEQRTLLTVAADILATEKSPVQVLLLVTLITLAPSLVIMLTSFTRIIVVLGFVRSAIGIPQTPPIACGRANGSGSGRVGEGRGPRRPA